MKTAPGDALLVVDMQRDFVSGSLAVPGADEVVSVVTDLIKRFTAREFSIVYTGDAHPPDHCSFKEFGGRWPTHCVAGTPGARIVLPVAYGRDPVFWKGQQRTMEEYSAFQSPYLHSWLQQRDVGRVFICGLALDFCVKQTALDAVRLRYETVLVADATAAVTEEGRDKATRELVLEGVWFRTARWVET
jgi:nicotinamidase/pyrazinamidase